MPESNRLCACHGVPMVLRKKTSRGPNYRYLRCVIKERESTSQYRHSARGREVRKLHRNTPEYRAAERNRKRLKYINDPVWAIKQSIKRTSDRHIQERKELHGQRT